VKVQIERVARQDVTEMRERFTRELDCQFVHWSFIGRGLADIYLIRADGRVAGYGALSNKYDKGRLIEFYTLPEFRGDDLSRLTSSEQGYAN
jgi:GNAT superfamily N-acetyltransferase